MTIHTNLPGELFWNDLHNLPNKAMLLHIPSFQNMHGRLIALIQDRNTENCFPIVICSVYK